MPRTEPCAERIVIQSHGMGVESQAILERWVAEPESRPFVTWDQLIVVTAQVGEEHKKDTIRDCEARMLPLLRQHGVRFVELARKGFHEEDGIVVLQDTREPTKLHPDGVFSLSQYLLRSGTVPQFGGEHRCAMKFKAFVIETWLALEFQHLELNHPVYHVFGYNADEVTRTDKSEYHIQRHNADREIDAPKTPLMVFGYNSDEVTRVERAKLYDGPSRIGHYPLDEWGWNRAKCIGYILQQAGIVWRKSACSFCLAGDTEVMTKEGVAKISDLVGGEATLLVPAGVSLEPYVIGVWGKYPIRSFGVQPVMALKLKRGKQAKTITCTADHRWFIRTQSSRKRTVFGFETTTAELWPGVKLQACSDGWYEEKMCWTVVAVEPAGEAEVFCATVNDVGYFTLADNLLTGNCPFCAEAAKGEDDAVARWTESPEDTAKGMLVEYNSLCFNPRGHLYKDRALIDVVKRKQVTEALRIFEQKLAELPWAAYRVRRIYTKKGKAMRYVEKLPHDGESREKLLERLRRQAGSTDRKLVTQRDIDYVYFAEREEDVYPTLEGFYVVAPAFMENKLRGKPEAFEERWNCVKEGRPLPTGRVSKKKSS